MTALAPAMLLMRSPWLTIGLPVLQNIRQGILVRILRAELLEPDDAIVRDAVVPRSRVIVEQRGMQTALVLLRLG